MKKPRDLKSVIASRGLSMSGFARRAGVNKSSVTRWAQTQVPAERVVELERRTGIPRDELRPDLYAKMWGR